MPLSETTPALGTQDLVGRHFPRSAPLATIQVLAPGRWRSLTRATIPQSVFKHCLTTPAGITAQALARRRFFTIPTGAITLVLGLGHSTPIQLVTETLVWDM